MEKTMNSQGSCAALYYSVVDPGGATGSSGGDGGRAEGFLGMFGADRHYSSGELFDVVRQGGAGGGSSIMEVPPGHLPPPSSHAAVALLPPSDEMAAWLYPIVRGDERAFTGQDDLSGDHSGHAAADDQQAAQDHKREKVVDDQQAAADHKREDKIPTKTEDKCRAEDSTRFLLRKKATGGARKTHHAQTHNLTEKRRRCKINEKFKTLQHLVPGCHKSNQVSTLDQTIQYMKSLQQQVQAMSFGCSVKPAAVYPVMSPAYLPPAVAAVRPGVNVVLAQPQAMVPFGPMLPLANHNQYAAAAMAASAPTLYPGTAAAPNVSVVAAPAPGIDQGCRIVNSSTT